MIIQDLSLDELTRRLTQPGLRWHSGPFVVELQASVPGFAKIFQNLYGLHPLAADTELASFHFQLRPGPWYRRWWRPQAWFYADDQVPFAPFPADHAMPLFEWGMNWVTASRVNHLLILHAAALERRGCVLVLPAQPQAGKSTLAAALMQSGWRLFSDEMAMIHPDSGLVFPLVRPLALKNASIEIIRKRFPEAELGPQYTKTRKGVVAHLRPTCESVAAMAQAAPPAWVVTPKYSPNAPTLLRELEVESRFTLLAGNSYNYEFLGKSGFHTILKMCQTCAFYELTYSNLDEAIAVLDDLTKDVSIQEQTQTLPQAKPEVVPVQTTRPPSDVSPDTLLWQVLRQPSLLANLSLPDMEMVLRLAQRHHVLARLGAMVHHQPFWSQLPMAAQTCFQSAMILANEQQRAVLWELNRVQRALFGNCSTRLILLKGAAYVAAGLPLANGRWIRDLDLLVPEEALADVEAQLQKSGWISGKQNPYDQRYYREWMHELPPMHHPERGTEVDLHHAILPRTSRLSHNSHLLLKEARPCAQRPGVWLLHPCDQILHAAVHLFHDGALEHAVRDLMDLAGLFHEGDNQPDFWDKLFARAQESGLQRPLYYALRYTQQWVDNSLPAEWPLSAGKPSWWMVWSMDWLVQQAVNQRRPDQQTWSERTAAAILYIRSHWLRMPFQLLVRHLLHQWWWRSILGNRNNHLAWPPQPRNPSRTP
ncbi:MAG: HprK-related kinase A [Magnetococcales bacterium]|nr:HprK-related kinase A [Magnetococcales bacterium]NGZ26565.1 HprK-related kinase A [Magnetococcales bacterium]